MKIAVIGAGIIGASVAYHLTRKGAQVEIIEAQRPGFGTSTATFAYLNAIRHPKAYAALRLLGIDYWHTLAGELGAEDLVHTDGALFCSDNPGDTRQLEAHAAVADEIGLQTQWLSREAVMREHEPDLDLPSTGEPVLRVPQEGRLEAAPMIGRLLAAAQARGARVHRRSVRHISINGQGVALSTDGDVIDVDRAVICAGPQSPELLEAAGFSLPIETRPGVTIVTRPTAVRLKHIVYAHKIHFKPDGGGRILAGRTDYRKRMPGADEVAAHGGETLALLRQMLRGFHDPEPECVRVGVRSIPGDGLPVVGPVPGAAGLYIAVSHSGISLGGLLGSLAADEIVSDRVPDALAAYRPDRFGDGAQLKSEFAPWAPGDVDWDAKRASG